MPQILVVTDAQEGNDTVVYRERILSSDLESNHYSGQLVERVSWAVRDANQIEHETELRRRSVERGAPLTSVAAPRASRDHAEPIFQP